MTQTSTCQNGTIAKAGSKSKQALPSLPLPDVDYRAAAVGPGPTVSSGRNAPVSGHVLFYLLDPTTQGQSL